MKQLDLITGYDKVEKPKLSQATIIPPKLKPGNFKLSQAVTIPPKLKEIGITRNQSSNQ